MTRKSRALPKMIIGMLKSRPTISSSQSPLAAAAIAMTLSRLITASATMMVRAAAHRLPRCSPGCCGSSSSGRISLTAIQSSSPAPISFRNGTLSSVPMNRVKMMRSTTAGPTPSRMPHLRWSSGNERQASAMTTALSPLSRTLIQTISARATQKCVSAGIGPVSAGGATDSAHPSAEGWQPRCLTKQRQHPFRPAQAAVPPAPGMPDASRA